MDNCIFCKIIDGSIPSKTIYEDEIVKAFLDINPLNPGHTLIIPKRHVANYFDLSDNEQQDLWHMLNHCKTILEKRFHPDGFNIGINVNEAAGQSVFHVHIHLETLNHIMKVAKDIKLRIEERLNPDGIRLLQNNGILQDVKHFHLHLIPTYKEDKDFNVDKVFEILK